MKTRSDSVWALPLAGLAAGAQAGPRAGMRQPAKPVAASGRPVRRALGELASWLQRARALNSQAL